MLGRHLEAEPAQRRSDVYEMVLGGASSIVAAGRSAGVPGLPESNDWTAWNADEMRGAVEHLQQKLSR